MGAACALDLVGLQGDDRILITGELRPPYMVMPTQSRCLECP